MFEGSILLLAGGRSRRMGRDKRLISLPNQNHLLAETAGRVSFLGAPIYLAVAARDASRPQLEGVAVLWDKRPHEGPLTAIADAADVVEAPLLVMASDLPFLRPQFLERLLAEAKERPDASAVVPRGEQRIHPLCAIYRKEALETFQKAVEEGERSVVNALEKLPAPAVHWLPVEDEWILRNWNHPEDRRDPAPPEAKQD